MAKLVVVCVASGQVESFVAKRMLKEGWRVRGVTCNVTSDAAKTLAALGAELTTVDYDEEASLEKAFEAPNAIFAVTNFWEHVMALGQEGAGKKEYDQMLTIASAASKIASLEHFVLHTLASGEKLAGPKYACPHWDYKDRAADEIKRAMPELAGEDDVLVDWVPGSYGAHVWLSPCRPDTTMWTTDVENNVGVFVNHVLAKPEISLPAKYVSVHTDIRPYADALAAWSEVSGKRAEYIEISDRQEEGIFGVYGKELRMNEVVTDWATPYGADSVTGEELGILASELLDLKQAPMANKEKL